MASVAQHKNGRSCHGNSISVKGNVLKSTWRQRYDLHFNTMVSKYGEQANNCETARK
jgi:hypothetical protein